jgi:hypothetical protein
MMYICDIELGTAPKVSKQLLYAKLLSTIVRDVVVYHVYNCCHIDYIK